MLCDLVSDAAACVTVWHSGVQVMAQGLVGFTRRPESLLPQSMPSREPVDTEASGAQVDGRHGQAVADGDRLGSAAAHVESSTHQGEDLIELL